MTAGIQTIDPISHPKWNDKRLSSLESMGCHKFGETTKWPIWHSDHWLLSMARKRASVVQISTRPLGILQRRVTVMRGPLLGALFSKTLYWINFLFFTQKANYRSMTVRKWIVALVAYVRNDKGVFSGLCAEIRNPSGVEFVEFFVHFPAYYCQGICWDTWCIHVRRYFTASVSM